MLFISLADCSKAMEKYLIRKRKAPGEDCEESRPSSSISSSVAEAPPRADDTSTPSSVCTAEAGPSKIRSIGEVSDAPSTEKQGRRFQPTWKSTYKWLSYNVHSDKAFCETCCTASEMKLPLPNTSQDKDSYLAFVKNGFSNWKKAIDRFKSHERSNFHKEACNAVVAAKGSANVAYACAKGKAKEMDDARQALLATLSSLLYLSTQGLAIRGHEDTESNLRQLLELRANDIPSLRSWLLRTKYKWISHQILNEMVELMAHDILRSLTDEVRAAEHYAVIMDETADISVKEQLSVCFRVVTESLEVEELFCGFFNTTDTTATSLFAILKDILCRFNLPIEKCRGQCYDGAANMRGKHRGVQALMQEQEPRALYVHCLAHILNLVLHDVGQKVDMCRDFLYAVTELINFVTCSPKRVASFQEIQVEEDVNLRKFCPTRWTLKASSLRSVLSNYSSLITFFSETASEERTEAGAKASGFLRMLFKFESFFMLTLLTKVFSRMEALNTALQKRTLRFDQAEKMVKSVTASVAELRQSFPLVWEEVLAEAGKVGV